MYGDTQDKIDLIQVFEADQDIAGEIHRLELLTDDDKNNGENHYLLATLYYRVGLFEWALRELEKALQLEYDQRKVWRALGLVKLSLGQFEKAINAYKRAVESGMPEHEANESISSVLREKEAYLVLEFAGKKQEVDISTLMLIAEQRAHYHQYRNCLNACGVILEREPKNRDATILQAHCTFSLATLPQEIDKVGFKAVVQSGQLAAQEPENLDLVWFHGLCLNLWGLNEEEKIIWQHYLKLDTPNNKNWVGHKRTKIVSERMDSLQKKEDLLYRFGRFKPSSSSTGLDLIDQGLLAMKKWNVVLAERNFKKAMGDESLSADGFFNLGYLLYCQRKLEEADLLFEKAMSKAPNFIEARTNIDLLKGVNKKK